MEGERKKELEGREGGEEERTRRKVQGKRKKGLEGRGGGEEEKTRRKETREEEKLKGKEG